MGNHEKSTTRQDVKSIRRILVACHEPTVRGGLLRFKRFGREFVKRGGELIFLAFTDSLPDQVDSEFEFIDYEQARSQSWDVTMVPGQGFPEPTIEKFSMLTRPSFGYRVQHILNAPLFKNGFLEVNKTFKPDLVVFNNRHWEPGSWVPFQARKFIFIEGAVDTDRFAPQPRAARATSSKIKVIGGLAKPRSIEPLLGAMALLPEHFLLQLYGSMKKLPEAHQSLADNGRVRLLGTIDEEALPVFYHQCDCVVHSEHFAGWANLAAEALACGVPLVCTPHGTLPLAVHDETAVVIDVATPETIAEAVERLLGDEALGQRLAEEGRRRICELNWSKYTNRLLEACVDDHRFHYTFAPELGLHGKWPLANRLSGLNEILSACRDKTVLDLGSAEGCISYECLRNGAVLVHGFELDPLRVETARELCSEFESGVFRETSLSPWENFAQSQADLLLDRYDIVLYLGIHHHLPDDDRNDVLEEVLKRTGKLIAVRVPERCWEVHKPERLIFAAGFELFSQSRPAQKDQGGIRIYTRP